MKYKKLYGREEFELIPYVKEYLENNQGIELLIGCDSQNFADKTIYAVVVALYTPGKGAHVLYRRWKANREPARSVRCN
jgi:predicted RNase H-related nuclease YkuK (DUF458 family)